MPLSNRPLEFWREEIGRKILNLDFRAHGDAPFETDIRSILDHNGVRVVRWRYSPGVTFRDDTMVKDGTNSSTLIYPVTSKLTVSQARRENVLQPKEATILRNWEPGEVGSPLGSDFVAVLVPGDAFGATNSARHMDRAARRVPRSNDALRLLQSYVAALDRLPGTEGGVATTASRHIADLVHLVASLTPGETASDVAQHHPRLAAALSYIETHFKEFDLSEARVARQQGISTRYLQMLFEKSGLSFTSFVSELRLSYAFRLLTDPGFGDRSILDIAHDAGFADISHFNRCFKRRYGATPSAIRSAKDVL